MSADVEEPIDELLANAREVIGLVHRCRALARSLDHRMAPEGVALVNAVTDATCRAREVVIRARIYAGRHPVPTVDCEPPVRKGRPAREIGWEEPALPR